MSRHRVCGINLRNMKSAWGSPWKQQRSTDQHLCMWNMSASCSKAQRGARLMSWMLNHSFSAGGFECDILAKKEKKKKLPLKFKNEDNYHFNSLIAPTSNHPIIIQWAQWSYALFHQPWLSQLKHILSHVISLLPLMFPLMQQCLLRCWGYDFWVILS